MTSQRIFNFPNQIPSWYIGHMSKSIKEIQNKLKQIDLLIELRDSRLPLSSINSKFENLILQQQQKQQQNNLNEKIINQNLTKRLIIYNKKDLADQRLENPIKEAFLKNGQNVLFTNTRLDQDIKLVLRKSIEIVESKNELDLSNSLTTKLDHQNINEQIIKSKNYSQNKLNNFQNGINIMVCGMPNVGKSSLLNALRRVGCQKGKVASEAPMPGHTRSIGGKVKILEPCKLSNGKSIYIIDTPGIMPIYLGKGDEAASRAFKMAITAGIKDSLFDSFDLSSYLLHLLIKRHTTPTQNLSEIFKILSIKNSIDLESILLNPLIDLPIEEFLKSIAFRIKSLESGGLPNLFLASQYFLKVFRDGKFGNWTLDDLGQYDDDNAFQLDSSNSNSFQQTQIKAEEEGEEEKEVKETKLNLNELNSRVIEKVTNFLNSDIDQIQSKTSIKMNERRKIKQIQRSQSLMNLKNRKSKR